MRRTYSIPQPEDDLFRRPDWVILGARGGPEGVIIIASRDLDKAEIEAIRPPRLDYYDIVNGSLFLERTRYEIRVGMRMFTYVQAPTYEQAFARLFESWNPDTPPGAGDG